MARDAHDREDLIREATGLVDRIELRWSDQGEPVVCGFRDCGSFSLFWTPDEVFQFNQSAELRRCFWHGKLAGSYLRKLHWLVRNESARVRLQREPLTSEEHQGLATHVAGCLSTLGRALDEGSAKIVGLVSPMSAESLIARIGHWVDDQIWLTDPLSIPLAKTPGLGRRRNEIRPE